LLDGLLAVNSRAQGAPAAAPTANVVFAGLVTPRTRTLEHGPASGSVANPSGLGDFNGSVGSAPFEDLGAWCARVRVALLEGGATDRDRALQHALFGGTLRASRQVLERAWLHVLHRCGHRSYLGNQGDRKGLEGGEGSGEGGGSGDLPVACLARLLGSRRFARESLELPSALPLRVAWAVARAVAGPPSAANYAAAVDAAAAAGSGAAADAAAVDAAAVDAAADAAAPSSAVSAARFAAWCAPPRPVGALVGCLLAVCQSTFDGDLDAMYAWAGLWVGVFVSLTCTRTACGFDFPLIFSASLSLSS
jgi:hypothetical protein